MAKLNILTLCLVFMRFLQLGSGGLTEFQPDHEIEHLAQATKRIIQQYYGEHTSGLSLIQLAMHPRANYKQSEIINRILLSTKAAIGYVLEEAQYMKASPFLRFHGIILLDGYRAFRQFQKHFTTRSVHNAGYFTIILLSEYAEQSEVTKIFIECWKHYMINVNIIKFDANDGEVNVYTYFPYTPSHCEHIESIFLMSLNNKSIDLRTQYFPDKLRNFHGCPLWLATYAIPPYMIVTELSNGSYQTDGIEGNLYRELGSTLNFRPMVRIGHERYLGSAKENFRILREKKANLTMFAIVNTIERSKEFTASFPYAYVSVVFTTGHGTPFTPLEKLKLPFESSVWYCIVFACCATLFVIIYLYGCAKKWQHFVFGEKNQTPYLNFINVSLGGVLTQAPIRNFARTIFLIWLLGSLILRSSYQGALFSFLQSQKSAVVLESLEELAKYNFTIYASVQILRLLEMGSPQLSHSLKLHDGSFDILEELKKFDVHESFVTTSDVIGYHNLKHFKTGTIRPSKERIFLLPLSIFMAKHSCLESIVNRQIELFTSNGMIKKWCNVFQEKLHVARKPPRQQPKKLKFIEISGAFKLCTFLYGGCTMLFIAEVISVKFRYLRKLFDHV